MIRLNELLRNLHRWVACNGKVLLDCSDFEFELRENPEMHIEQCASAVCRNAYIGEFEMHFEADEQIGATFGWLYVPFEKLKEMATDAGWDCYEIAREGCEYLAELRKTTENAKM